jgi:hypothetical protein
LEYRTGRLLPLSVFAGLLILVMMASCRVNYSFTGASISPDIKSISIQYFANNAPLVVPTLARSFTEALRDYFTSQTNLVLVNSGGDLSIEGAITGYSVQPAAIQGNETAGLNRVTITVNVKFVNRKNEKQNFDQNFSRYQDYSSTKDLNAVQDQLIKDINDQLVQDIFNKSMVNW